MSVDFEPLSFEQNNPFLTGFARGQDIYKNTQLNKALPEQLAQQSKANDLRNAIAEITAKYAEPNAQQSLRGKTLSNSILENTANYAPRMSEATLAQKLAQNEITKSGSSLPGIAGQLAALQHLAKTNPQVLEQAFGSQQQAQSEGSQEQQSHQSPQMGNMAKLGIMQGNGSMNNYAQNQQLPMSDQQKNIIDNKIARSPFAGQSTLQSLQNALIQKQFAPSQQKQIDAEKLNAQRERYDVINSPYSNLPADAKSQVIAQANSFGYSPDEAVKQLTHGKSIEDLAANKGFSKDSSLWPDPQYAPTAALRAFNTKRNATLAELNSVEKDLSNDLGDYAQRIGDVSPKQVYEAAMGLNPDKQAKFVGAAALAPEMAALRIKVMGGQIGVTAMHDIIKAANNNFKIYQGFLTPEVYKKSNDYVQQKLEKMNKSYNKVINGRTQEAIKDVEKPQQTTKVLDGKQYHFINGEWMQ